MKTFALKYKNQYYMFTQNKSDLDVYKNNKMTSIVELEIIKDDEGKYWLFEDENGDIFIDTIEIMFKERIKDKKGIISKIIFKEV